MAAKYVVWQDDNPKKTLVLKIEEALENYRKNHGEPTVILIPPDAVVEMKQCPIPIRGDKLVRNGYVYIGHDE